MSLRTYLYNTEKIKYVKGEKPDVECILCAIRDRHPDVESLEVTRTENFIVTVNLYPFNPGHLMIFPARHVDDLQDFTDEEALELHKLINQTLSILNDEFSPHGYNVGYNLGRGSGASISHVHVHIVPRYENEIGFIDVIDGARVVVVDPVLVMQKLRKRFNQDS